LVHELNSVKLDYMLQ